MENVISAIKAFFSSIPEWITELANLPAGSSLAYTAVVRWVPSTTVSTPLVESACTL